MFRIYFYHKKKIIRKQHALLYQENYHFRFFLNEKWLFDFLLEAKMYYFCSSLSTDVLSRHQVLNLKSTYTQYEYQVTYLESNHFIFAKKKRILRIDFRIFPTLNGIFLKAVWIFCNCGRALAKFVTHNKLAGGTNTTLKNCPFSDVLTFQVRFLFLIFMPSFSRAIYNYTTV